MPMSKKLQVLLEEEELDEIRDIARRRRMTVSEWVRKTLRTAIKDEPRTAVRAKLDAIEAASAYAFPAGDVDTMLDEISRGRLEDGSV